MMEGDLLEVSLDETHHIWRILHASAPTHKQLCYDVSLRNAFFSVRNLFEFALQRNETATEVKPEYQLNTAVSLKTAKPKPKKKEPVVKNKLKVVLGQSKEKLQPKKQLLVKKKVRVNSNILLFSLPFCSLACKGASFYSGESAQIFTTCRLSKSTNIKFCSCRVKENSREKMKMQNQLKGSQEK